MGDFFIEAAEKAAQKFGVPKAVKEAADVINDPDVDAVWICSPSQFHADQIKMCAEAGKHIFCEKPIATNLAETVEAVKFCEEKGVKLMVTPPSAPSHPPRMILLGPPDSSYISS